MRAQEFTESKVADIKKLARAAAKKFKGGDDAASRNPHPADSYLGKVWRETFDKMLKRIPDEPIAEDEAFPDVKTYSPEELAKKHGVPLEQIMKELEMGIKVEYEHTKDKATSREIALDHLLELPDYYTRLHQMEKEGDVNEEKFEKSELGMGMTQYENSNFALVGGWRSGSSSAGTTRLRYMIYDIKLFKEALDNGMERDDAQGEAEVGLVDLFAQDGTGDIVGLVNIELKPKFRRQGRGRQIIQDLKDTTETGFNVHDIQKKAKTFWKKQGVEFDSKLQRSGRINK